MSKTGEYEAICAAVKGLMRGKRMRHRDLAAELGISEPTVKRILTKGPMPVDRLLAICDILEVSFIELVELVKQGANEELSWMTEEQERFLLDNPDAAEFLIQIMNGSSVDQITKLFALREETARRYVKLLVGKKLMTAHGHKNFRIAREVLRGPRPGGKLSLDFNRRCATLAPSLVKKGLEQPSDNLPTRSDYKETDLTIAVGYNLTLGSRREMVRQVKEVMTRFSAIEKQEAQSQRPDHLGPITFIVCLKELSLYAEAYRTSIHERGTRSH